MAANTVTPSGSSIRRTNSGPGSRRISRPSATSSWTSGGEAGEPGGGERLARVERKRLAVFVPGLGGLTLQRVCFSEPRMPAGIARIDRQRLLEHPGVVVDAAHLSIEERQVEARLGVTRIELPGLQVRLDRSVPVA